MVRAEGDREEYSGPCGKTQAFALSEVGAMEGSRTEEGCSLTRVLIGASGCGRGMRMEAGGPRQR